MSEPTAMDMEEATSTATPAAPQAAAPTSSQPAESKRGQEEEQLHEPAAALTAAPVHPSMVLAMERRCEAARLRLQELRERCKELEYVTSHRALTQSSGVAAEPCPCITSMHTILDTKNGIATRADPDTTRASASASAIAPFSSPSSPSPRFDIAGLRVDALQSFLTRDGQQLEQWRISVQLTNPTQRRFEQLQLDLLEEPAAISRLSTMCRTASLGPGQSVCLALQLHIPDDRPALSLGVSLSWLESKHWTSSHHIASITLPPWAAQGQHMIMRHPNSTAANEPSTAPMLSLLDVAHHVGLTLLSDANPAAAAPMSDSAAAAASASAGFRLQSVLHNHFGFESPPPSSVASSMLPWLRSIRSSLSSVDVSSFLVQTVAPRLTVCLTGDRSLLALASSPADLMRFTRALQLQLPSTMRVTVEESESDVQRAGARLLAAMTRENEAQVNALQRSFPDAFAAASNGPRANGPAALPATLHYLRQTTPMQEATNQAAAAAVALL